MKRCPACQTTYTDDSLRFCLTDGNVLVHETDDSDTVVAGRGGVAGLAADRARDMLPTSSGASTFIKIAVAAVVLGFVALAALGLAGAAFYYGSGGNVGEQTRVDPSPTPGVRPTTDLEKERMKDELANIRKKLDAHKTVTTDQKDDDPGDGETVSATAHSPGDGFLALRSTPNAETGTLMAKIPHGATIEIVRCNAYTTTGRGAYGRWCRARYDGLTGWVFDAFVRY